MTKHAPSAAPTHTLPSLVSALGGATLDEALALVEGASKAALVKEGASIATPRIGTDAARMYGEAFDFLEHAKKEQLEQMPVMSRDWLRIAAGAAAEGDRRYAALNSHAADEATKRAITGAHAETTLADAEAKRGQLHVALIAVAALAPALLAEAETAYGSATDPGAAVRAQTALARKWRTSGNAGVKARMKASRLTDQWLATADAVGERSSAAAMAAAATRSKGSLTQGDVDHLDGVNLSLLRTLVASFEAAHAADPSIPRITFNSLRSHVHRSHHVAPNVTPTPTTGATAHA